MADLSVTAANVGVKSSSTKVVVVQVGESVTQGQPGYKKASDSKYYKADANASLEASKATGVFMSAASTDGYAIFATLGAINLGATLTVGETYFVSGTAGGIAPAADVATGWYPRLLGQATSASELYLEPSGGTVARA